MKDKCKGRETEKDEVRINKINIFYIPSLPWQVLKLLHLCISFKLFMKFVDMSHSVKSVISARTRCACNECNTNDNYMNKMMRCSR